MSNRSAFIHKPKSLAGGVFFHPLDTKILWDTVWNAAKAQDWYEPDLCCVGNKDGFFYFQIRGLTTGFARVTVDLDPAILHRTDLVRQIAEKFVELLHRDLSKTDFSAMRRLNSTPAYSGNACASHDFLDANETMDEAMVAVLRRSVVLDDDGDVALWNDAWQEAKPSITARAKAAA
jgi:hypothetical protein